MTPEQHAHVQELEGLVKRYRSRIVEEKTRAEQAEAETLALRAALEELLAVSGDPNAGTGEFDTMAGRARRVLQRLARVAAIPGHKAMTAPASPRACTLCDYGDLQGQKVFRCPRCGRCFRVYP